MPSVPDVDTVERLVKSALEKQYSDGRETNVVVTYQERDGGEHIVRCRAFTQDLQRGRWYKERIDGRRVSFQPEEQLGLGGEYRLRVSIGHPS